MRGRASSYAQLALFQLLLFLFHNGRRYRAVLEPLSAAQGIQRRSNRAVDGGLISYESYRTQYLGDFCR